MTPPAARSSRRRSRSARAVATSSRSSVASARATSSSARATSWSPRRAAYDPRARYGRTAMATTDRAAGTEPAAAPSDAAATGKPGLIAHVIAASARNPLITILLVIGLGVWGWLSLSRAPLDAIPDLSDAQVIIFTEWMGRSPDLVEDQITYPISTSLIAAPAVKYVRGQSMFGMSFVYVIFEDGTDIYWARSRVLEYLNEAQARLPEGVKPTLGPDAT